MIIRPNLYIVLVGNSAHLCAHYYKFDGSAENKRMEVFKETLRETLNFLSENFPVSGTNAVILQLLRRGIDDGIR